MKYFKESLKIPVSESMCRSQWDGIENEGKHKKGYLGYNEHYRGSVFVDNFVFEDTLQFIGFLRKRSSVKAHFISVTNKDILIEYEMFISDFENIIKENIIDNGVLKGKFSFRKKGANYGLYMVKGKK